MKIARSWFVVACALLLAAGVGCASKKKAVAPTPAPEAVIEQPAASAEAEQAQPLGAEGFAEQPVQPEEGAGQDAASSATAAEIAAALKPVYFSYDSDELSPEALSTLAANADWLARRSQVAIVVEGHCDERGTIEYNLALGQRRARAVRDHLLRLGIAAARVETISYGKERPAAVGHDESTWSRNRRAEFRAAGS